MVVVRVVVNAQWWYLMGHLSLSCCVAHSSSAGAVRWRGPIVDDCGRPKKYKISFSKLKFTAESQNCISF